MQNKKLIILIILVALAILSLIRGIITPSETRRVKPVTIQKKEHHIAVEGIISPARHTKKSTYTSWGRNPFRPTGHGAGTSSELSLNGILWDEKTPLAIINDNMVGLGDKVGGNTVIDIRPNKVILNDGINDFELRL